MPLRLLTRKAAAQPSGLNPPQGSVPWAWRVVTLLVWLVTGLLLARLGYGLWLASSTPPPAEVVVPAAPVGPPPLSALERSLGARQGQESPLSAADVRLVGLMASPQGGVVSLSIRSGPVRQLVMGQTAADGWRFSALEAGEVVLVNGAQQLRIPAHAPRNGLPTASSPR